MKTTYKILAIFFACTLGYASMSAEDEIYDVDGVKYKIFTQSDCSGKFYGGAYVTPNKDETTIYSGKITIPAEVTLNGTTYPVWGFQKLSFYPEYETNDLEIILPEGLKTFNGERVLIPSFIKSINLPTTVRDIHYCPYPMDIDTVYFSTDFLVSSYAGFSAKHISFEDGYGYLGTNAIYCENDTLVLPGSIKTLHCSINDENLKCLHITKSKTGRSPEFGWVSFQSCFDIKSVICEYEVPPTAADRAFSISADNEELGVTGRATLYVPAEAIEAYRAHPEWGKFKEILPITNGVTDVSADEAAEVIATEYYDLSGRRLQAPAESGITIVATRYSDGSRRTAKLAK